MAELGPSEFDGTGSQRNTIAPPPHEMTPSEKMRLVYLTGQDEDQTAVPDSGESFRGE